MNKTSDIIWQEKQHQDLFEIVESLPNQQGGEILERLQEYVHHHFQMEEHYLDIPNYPDTDKHKALHARFAQRVKTYIDAYDPNDAHFKNSLSQFLKDWMHAHVYGVDKELEKFILDSQSK